MAGTTTIELPVVRADQDTLRLQEELLLLALDDEKGVVSRSAEDRLPDVLARATLIELRLEGRVHFEGSGSTSPVLAQPGPPRELSHWLEVLPERCDLAQLAAQALCRRGVLSEERGRFLLVFSRQRYPEVDPRAEVEVVRRLRDAVFTDLSEVDLRTALLAILAAEARLLDLCFDPAEVRKRKKRIDRLMAGEYLGRGAARSEQGALFDEVSRVLDATPSGS